VAAYEPIGNSPGKRTRGDKPARFQVSTTLRAYSNKDCLITSMWIATPGALNKTLAPRCRGPAHSGVHVQPEHAPWPLEGPGPSRRLFHGTLKISFSRRQGTGFFFNHNHLPLPPVFFGKVAAKGGCGDQNLRHRGLKGDRANHLHVCSMNSKRSKGIRDCVFRHFQRPQWKTTRESNSNNSTMRFQLPLWYPFERGRLNVEGFGGLYKRPPARGIRVQKAHFECF